MPETFLVDNPHFAQLCRREASGEDVLGVYLDSDDLGTIRYVGIGGVSRVKRVPRKYHDEGRSTKIRVVVAVLPPRDAARTEAGIIHALGVTFGPLISTSGAQVPNGPLWNKRVENLDGLNWSRFSFKSVLKAVISKDPKGFGFGGSRRNLVNLFSPIGEKINLGSAPDDRALGEIDAHLTSTYSVRRLQLASNLYKGLETGTIDEASAREHYQTQFQQLIDETRIAVTRIILRCGGRFLSKDRKQSDSRGVKWAEERRSWAIAFTRKGLGRFGTSIPVRDTKSPSVTEAMLAAEALAHEIEFTIDLVHDWNISATEKKAIIRDRIWKLSEEFSPKPKHRKGWSDRAARWCGFIRVPMDAKKSRHMVVSREHVEAAGGETAYRKDYFNSKARSRYRRPLAWRSPEGCRKRSGQSAISAYTRAGCRCEECTTTWRLYQRQYRSRHK